eukprot:CAMPEP_0114342308 /NCGR_PEP_ID=MMETSP0101-20121206/9703_1 /TAXON_ID=38822 ORGANISM="Pteridomonas danica, Strain PT" /NCGR_SAMPLE_ID=MMETSP0101 /ASSEMBLY_ACC=CAM_ASM_000211 /LENGTH=250 /DNA_ID=CAMNT_0001476353 /DNA_START=497 /DNA_END=1251 /DNA_ORIENTATION=-
MADEILGTTRTLFDVLDQYDDTSNAVTPDPLGAIDTRLIKANILNSQLFLEPTDKGSKTTCLRISTRSDVVAAGASMRASAQFDDDDDDDDDKTPPSISDWMKAIIESSTYSNESSNPMVKEDTQRNSLLQHRISTSSRSNQMIKQQQTSFMSDASQGIELQPVTANDNNKSDDDAATAAVAADKNKSNEDGYENDRDNHDIEIPRNLHIFLVVFGVQRYEPTVSPLIDDQDQSLTANESHLPSLLDESI